jgi:hypothetical protein
MEPGHEEKKDKVPRTEEKEAKPRRFRIVKLEERIAPSQGGNSEPWKVCGRTNQGFPHCF